MGHSKPLRLSNFLSAGLLLVLCFGFCVHSSAVSSEVVSSKRYILQSYYEKHEKFSDSDFQDFVAQELPFGLCEFLPCDLSLLGRVSIMHRNLIGKGSHRHLISSTRVSIKPESIFELPSHYCEVMIIERLPSGVFADPFELQHLLLRGVYSNIAVFGDTNLELSSFLSNRSAVEVHMDIGHNPLLRHGEDFTINVEIPIHARYPPLDDSGYWEVKFGVPDLFMRCSVEGKSHNQSCLYMMPENNSSEQTYGTVVWKLPSGMKVHAGIVSILTFVSALVSAILIAATSLLYSELNSSKHLKKA